MNKLNSNIKKIIGLYLLPSIKLVKKNKNRCLKSLSKYMINIKYYLDSNLISNDGSVNQKVCKNFTNKKYKHINDKGFKYWTLRE